MTSPKATAYHRHVKTVGKRLWNLALKWAYNGMPTQAEREKQIAAMKGRKQVINGSRSRKAARKAVDAAVHALNEERQKAKTRRHPIRPISNRQGRTPVMLPVGSLQDRLHKRITANIKNELHDLYRLNRHGKINVSLTKDPVAVDVWQTEDLDWDYYPASCRYPKRITNTTITVPSGWRTRVLKRGIAVVDSLLTLDAQLLEGTPPGIDVYAAVWIDQGRGYQLRAVAGYIAIGQGHSYHGSSARGAITGLRRKAGIQRAEAQFDDLLNRYNFDELVGQNPDLNVRLHDARATGACEYGIKSWCHRTGLDYDVSIASLARVYRAYREQPLPEARAAILHALRRQKRKVRRP